MAMVLVDYLVALEGDAWVGAVAEPAFLNALDAFFSQAISLQSKRLDVRDLTADERGTLQDTTAGVFALFMRSVQLLRREHPLDAERAIVLHDSVLHITRVVPFCQIFASRNPAEVVSLLEALSSNAQYPEPAFQRLSNVYATHFRQVHDAVGQHKRQQIVDLIQHIYEATLSVRALASAPSVGEMLFATERDEAVIPGSILHALAICYEIDVPVLQKSLLKLDDRAQKRVGLLVPETRRLLLQILSIALSFAMEGETKAGGSGESVLVIIHALSHCTEAENVDHGSFISDLWHLCGFEAKLLQFFEEVHMDRDNVSYLEVVFEGLPRRFVIDAEPKSKRQLAPHSTAGDDERERHASVTADAVDCTVITDPSPPDEIQLIHQIKDLFPDLGDGYIALCLLSSQNQLDTVINFLLESNPPPVLLNVPQDIKQDDPEYVKLERQVLGNGSISREPKKSEKVDPSRIWVGKKTKEKHYNPQVARQDPHLAEKMKQLVDEYVDEENFRDALRGGTVLDEYDDDYNDEFEDYEPFSVHDGGQTEDFDVIRKQNRRMLELEADEAYWESIRNQNRRAVDQHGEGSPADGDDGADGAVNGPRDFPVDRKEEYHEELRGHGPGGSQGQGNATPGSEQQTQRVRNRNTKNKAKVGNHNRKDRALKKRG